MSFKRWMHKEDVAPIDDGILLSHEKERTPSAATRMDPVIISPSKSEKDKNI